MNPMLLLSYMFGTEYIFLLIYGPHFGRNYDAELYAFGMRLQEEFDDGLLRKALTDASYIKQEIQRQKELGVSSPALDMSSNEDLADAGAKIITDYSMKFLRAALPLFPEEGIRYSTPLSNVLLYIFYRYV